jgi:hypothetical protein
VFGQIKQARGFRQFLLRGVDKVRAEWAMICTAHNLLKLLISEKMTAASKWKRRIGCSVTSLGGGFQPDRCRLIR